MKRILTIGIAIIAIHASNNTLATGLSNNKQKLSYALGQMAAMSMKLEGSELDTDVVLQAVRDGLEGNKPQLSREEVFDAINKNRTGRSKEAQLEAQKLLLEGNQFLHKNKKESGVVILESGVQYKIIKSGSGKKPAVSDIVQVHYQGTLVDGTKFDSSYDRGQPAVFGVDKVIAGWKEALQLMHVGAKWKLFIPSDLAYGPRGLGDKIPPNSVLIFEVELLEIK